MATRFGTIQITPAGKYRGRYRIKGRDYYTPHTTKRSQAEADLRIIQRQIKDGTWKPPTAKRKTITNTTWTTTIEQWGTQWLDACQKQGKSPNTVRAYKSILAAHIGPHLGNTPINALTATEIRHFHNKLKGTLAPVTVRNVMLVLSALLTAAADEGIIEQNPAKNIRGIYTKPSSQPRAKAVTANQLRRIIETADENLRAAYALAGWGALRYGEIAALQRQDIDLKSGTVTISKSVAREPGGSLSVKPPKSAAGNRTITLPDEAVETLTHHLANFTPPGKTALVFHRPSGNNGFLTDRVLRKHLHEICNQLDLPALRFHDLRHTGLTLYGQAGATLADLMHRAGHTSADTVMIYQHANRERDRDLTQRMGS